jgi:hypothetical protein
MERGEASPSGSLTSLKGADPLTSPELFRVASLGLERPYHTNNVL